MSIDERKVKLRDVIFAHKVRTSVGDAATDDEFKQMSQAFFKEDYQTLGESEKADVLWFLYRTVPDVEYEAAVEYLKRTVHSADMREILEIMVQDEKAGVKTKLPFPAKMSIRDTLRGGGFNWGSIYLGDNCQQLMLDAAKRYASEHPELGFDV